MRNFGVSGVGMYVPEKILTNEEIESWGIGASAEWIYKRSGIQERRIVSSDQVTSDLAAVAALEALEDSKIRPEEIDLIVISTLTPDFLLPQTSAIVKQKIGAVKATCFDIQAACAGFVFAFINAVNYGILNEEINNILVIGADTISKTTDWTNRRICSITGDGAGAVILKRIESLHGIKASYTYHECMENASQGCIPVHYGKITSGATSYFEFDGRYLYGKAMENIQLVIGKLLKKANWEIDEVKLFIFPQTNKNFICELMAVMNIPEEKTHMIMHKYGYTLNSCVPLALYDAVKQNKMKLGDKVVLIGHGAGIYCGGIALEWI